MFYVDQIFKFQLSSPLQTAYIRLSSNRILPAPVPAYVFTYNLLEERSERFVVREVEDNVVRGGECGQAEFELVQDAVGLRGVVLPGQLLQRSAETSLDYICITTTPPGASID